MLIIDRPLKIAHLSDLHFRSFIRSHRRTDQKMKFAGLLDSLESIGPDAVVVTGDSVHYPCPSNYSTQGRLLSLLTERLPNLKHVLVVPGNHDVSFLGNRLFNVRSGLPLYRFFLQRKFRYCLDSAISLFESTGVALFPLDSTGYRGFWGWAQGRVKYIDVVLRDLNKSYNEVATRNGWQYALAPKIAFLHHHPIPVSILDSIPVIHADQFLTLRGSQQLLHAAHQIGIRLILHGHIHVPSIARYVMFNDASIICSSCGSSCMGAPNLREFKIVTIGRSGEVSIDSYVSKGETTSFEHREDYSKKVIDYGDNRKVQSKSPSGRFNRAVLSAREKKKHVRIKSDGNCIVNVSVNGIHWKSRSKKRFLFELFRADYGRVVGGTYEFQSARIFDDVDPAAWKSSLLDDDGKYGQPNEPDVFRKAFPSDSSDTDGPFCFMLKYRGIGCYTTSVEEHEETYDGWQPRAPREECTSISVEYPCEYLQLLIQFQEPIIFPEPESIHFHVVKQCTPRQERHNLQQLKGEYDERRVRAEEVFLEKKGALKIHYEVGLIELIVKYPQPGLDYVLRWEVPKLYAKMQQPKNSARALKAQKAVLADKNFSAKLYDAICRKIAAYDWSSPSLKIFLLGYDGSSKLLVVVNNPPGHTPDSSIRIGRGAVGKAFRSQEAQFWKRPQAADDMFFPIEKSVRNLEDAVAVLSIPVLATDAYPEWIEAEKPEVRYPVLFLVSIVDTQEDSPFISHFEIKSPKEYGIEPDEEEERSEEVNARIETVRRALSSAFRETR